MSGPRLLLPLRVPELGPFLGKLVTGTGRTPGGLSLDALRYRLVSRIIEQAGEARRLAANEERRAAAAAVGRDAWLAAWEEAVRAVADRLADDVDRRLQAEAYSVRLPRRLRRRVTLDPAERRALAARLGSSGAVLIPALDELARRAEAALDATPLERERVAAWQDALRTAARRLEAAWIALEEAVEREAAQWREVADRLSRWRRPLWPVWLVGAALAALAAWLGLAYGGYLTPPAWLVRLWDRLAGGP